MQENTITVQCPARTDREHIHTGSLMHIGNTRLMTIDISSDSTTSHTALQSIVDYFDVGHISHLLAWSMFSWQRSRCRRRERVSWLTLSTLWWTAENSSWEMRSVTLRQTIDKMQ